MSETFKKSQMSELFDVSAGCKGILCKSVIPSPGPGPIPFPITGPMQFETLVMKIFPLFDNITR